MLRPRVIPCLLLSSSGLVKTVRFTDPKYVGDPLNAVRIFNEKEVDELAVLDIDATAEGKEPDYALIAQLAAECRMPLCYGGGVRTPEQFQRIIELGVEKVAISSAALYQPELITKAASTVGSQSIVTILDVSKRSGKYLVYGNRGTKPTDFEPWTFARSLQERGAGEIVLNDIDRDGTLIGYDHTLIKRVKESIDIPLTVLGGAGKLGHLKELFDAFGLIGAAAGSLFVFKGQYRAVLINYPQKSEKEALLPKFG
jgi:cyclase